jgi:hypothetical protein
MARLAEADADRFIHDPPAGAGGDGEVKWQERAYFTFHGPDGTGMDFGVGRHPDAGGDGAYSAYACLARDGKQTNVRAAGPLQSRLGLPDAKPFTFEIVEPHSEWRMQLGDNEVLTADLTFKARTATWELPKSEVKSKGQTVASTQVLFQSGHYHGHVELGGERIEVDGWPGTRDRSWGFRRFEGRLRSGLMVAGIFEFEDSALILWSIERRTGETVTRSGARLHNSGEITPVEDWGIDLSIDGEVGLVESAVLKVNDPAGDEEYHMTYAGQTVYLAGGGYLEKGRHGHAAEETEVYTDTYDLTDEATRRAITGLDDHVVNVTGTRAGSGVLELQLGKHERYLPEGWSSLHEEVADLGTRRL